MKFSLVFLGLFAIAAAAPLAIRRAEHATAGVVGGRDIQNGDMVRRSDNSPIHVVRANDDSIKQNLGENLETRQVEEVIEMVAAIVDLVDTIIDDINKDNTVRQCTTFIKSDYLIEHSFSYVINSPSTRSPSRYRNIQASTGSSATLITQLLSMASRTPTGATVIMNLASSSDQWGQSFVINKLKLSFLIFLNTRYDLYWFKSGTFTRKGDGGLITVCIPVIACNNDFNDVFRTVGLSRQRHWNGK